VEGYQDMKTGKSTDDMGKAEKELNYVRHFAIKGATFDTERFQFNTAISRTMELVNTMYKYEADVEVKNVRLYEDTITDLLKLIAPFTPHFAEEMWEQMGFGYSIFNHPWPQFDEKALVRDVIEMAVQINGVIRTKVEVPSQADQKEVEDIALSDDRVKPYTDGKQVVKVIVVKGRLVNIVVK
jgi:leucyl-tRNA synthetase